MGQPKGKIVKSLATLATILVLLQGACAQQPSPLGPRIAAAARGQIGVTKDYDPAYVVLAYPGGDVPLKTGVCCDVVVRALRKVGCDLQKEVHEDMARNFTAYPQRWGLKTPDKNIDHRRVPNLMCYFERRQLAVRGQLNLPESYRAGDIVAWNLGNGVLHIGVVSAASSGRTPLVIHNIGGGAKEEDILLKYQVIGHYRMKDITPPAARTTASQAAARGNQSPLLPRLAPALDADQEPIVAGSSPHLSAKDFSANNPAFSGAKRPAVEPAQF